MSVYQNTRAFTRTNSNKRSQDDSRTEAATQQEEGNKQKAARMANYADKNDIAELKLLISSVNNSIISLRNEVTAMKDDIQHAITRVDELEKADKVMKSDIASIKSDLNAINQLKLESQLSILNVPLDLDAQQALKCISHWSKIQLSEENFRRAAIVKPDGKNSAVFQLDFFDISVKRQLMKTIKINQKDANKKYVPITSEMIFEMSDNNPARGQELHFREPLTEFNRDIFNTARKHRSTFTNVWISRGYIMVKQNDGKVTKINSIDELNKLIPIQNNSTKSSK